MKSNQHYPLPEEIGMWPHLPPLPKQGKIGSLDVEEAKQQMQNTIRQMKIDYYLRMYEIWARKWNIK